MWVYFRTSTLHDDAQRYCKIAITEAAADGNAEAEAKMRLMLARVHAAAGVHEKSAAVDYDRRTRLYIAARGGDARAQRSLVEELSVLLWRAARRAGLDRDSATDAVQTAWLRLWQPEPQLEDPRAITKWLITTVKREAWRMIGGARLELTDPIDFPESDELRGELNIGEVSDAQHEALRRAFLALPERCRRLLAYTAAVDRPDYDQIAEVLGMKRGAIGPTRGRCLNKLRKILEADPVWTISAIGAGTSELSEDDPLDADDTRIIEMVDELHELYDPYPVL